MTLPSSFSLASVLRGHRRRRFMETADFNGAAKYIFNGLRKAVANGRVIGAAFMSVEMDPATPGAVASVVPISLQQEDIALAMSAQSSTVASMSAGFMRLLDHPEVPADLAVYVGPADVVSRAPGADAEQSVGLCLEIRSVDAAAVAVFRVDPEASPSSRLLFAPLVFRGPHSA